MGDKLKMPHSNVLKLHKTPSSCLTPPFWGPEEARLMFFWIFDQNFIFWPKFRFCQTFRFLTKISIFDQNFDFCPKFQFCQTFRFLSKISIFDQNFDFFQTFRFLSKISIFTNVWILMINLKSHFLHDRGNFCLRQALMYLPRWSRKHFVYFLVSGLVHKWHHY